LPAKPGRSTREDRAAAARSERRGDQERRPCAAPDRPQDDFEWLIREIREGGGEALICEARLVAGGGEAMVCEARSIYGLSDQEVRALFNTARDEGITRL
jgi:hypothetical protein